MKNLKSICGSLVLGCMLSNSITAYGAEGPQPTVKQKTIKNAPQVNGKVKGKPKNYFLLRPGRPHIGFFATFNLVLGTLYLYDAGKLDNLAGFKVDFGELGSYYDPEHGPNWWEYYFEPIELGSRENAKVTLSKKDHNQMAWEVRKTLSRGEANRVMHKYIKIKPYMLEKADQFAQENFKDYVVIGVHFRGTDKSHEAPPVSYEDALEVIAKQVASLNDDHYKIFLATDEQGFLDFMLGHFPDKIIYTQACRSTDSTAVHHSDYNAYQIGEEALLDALLLTKTQLLIRTSSSLSLWSTFYNVELPVIMLNHRYYNRPE